MKSSNWIRFSVTLLFFLGYFDIAFAQLDRSCNAVQLVKIKARVSHLPIEDQQRYQSTVRTLQKEVKNLFHQSRPLLQQYNKIVAQHVSAVISARPKLWEKYRKEVLKENEGLGGPEAEEQLNEAIWSRLEKDRTFAAELQSRLDADPEFDRVNAKLFREQTGPYHDTEKRLYGKVLETPIRKEVYEQQALAATGNLLNQSQNISNLDRNAIMASTAYQELLGRVAVARTAESAPPTTAGREFAYNHSQLVVDTEAVAVTEAAELLGDTLRENEGLLLRADLHFQHVESAIPALRRSSSAYRFNESASVVTESAIRAVHDRNTAINTKRRLREIVVPSPEIAPTDSASEKKLKLSQSAKVLAENVKIVTTKVRIVLLGVENE